MSSSYSMKLFKDIVHVLRRLFQLINHVFKNRFVQLEIFNRIFWLELSLKTFNCIYHFGAYKLFDLKQVTKYASIQEDVTTFQLTSLSNIKVTL